MGARAAKRAEERLTAAEMESVAAWYESSEGREWVELSLAEAERWPLYDFSDCRHGCNGDCVESGSERCTFMCHQPSP